MSDDRNIPSKHPGIRYTCCDKCCKVTASPPVAATVVTAATVVAVDVAAAAVVAASGVAAGRISVSYDATAPNAAVSVAAAADSFCCCCCGTRCIKCLYA